MRRILSGTTFKLCVVLFFGVLVYAQQVETVDGVRVVHNGKDGKWGKQARVSLELIKTLGDIDAVDENVAFYMPSDIAFDADGNWYILDSGNHRIQKFSPDGKYLATIGGEGQGPGEFVYPDSMGITANGLIFVSDPNNQRIQILDGDGSEKKTFRLIQNPPGTIHLLPDGKLISGPGRQMTMINMGDDKKKTELPPLMRVFDEEGNVQTTFGRQFDFGDMMLNRVGNSMSSTVDEAGNTYVAFASLNRIEKYALDGTPVWRADRELDYSMDPPKDKGKVDRKGGNVSISMPQFNRCSNGIAVDGKGRVWVVTFTRQIKEEEKVGTMISVSEQSGKRTMNMQTRGNTELQETDMFKLQVFDAEGVLLGDISLNRFVDGIRIHNDRLYMIDRMRGTKIYEYRIVE
ncbi:MAG: NHL repeat-containing protein [Acidobacteria bacterium]|nr:NHL repeat-containing protein [Acidobacteriota bacterium]MBU1339160.1 NHL repeat-containing protein [Acidobacteriota bacterium]MBU1473923.1 NHL repeat-containing protein [Acidobacteriota bacterium]MBU2437906.1 NHL repeat-containing protein [Acidobacteriota bacterium]